MNTKRNTPRNKQRKKTKTKNKEKKRKDKKGKAECYLWGGAIFSQTSSNIAKPQSSK